MDSTYLCTLIPDLSTGYFHK